MHPKYNKEEWMRSLEIGDFVCDCRCRHLRILAIEELWLAPNPPYWARCIIWNDYIPISWSFAMDRFYNWICKKFNVKILVDKKLILEESARCSAISCCDMVIDDGSCHKNQLG